MIKPQDFLKAELLGNQFIAVKGYSEILHRETKQLSAYRINVSIQDPESEFFMELIPVKVNNLNPSASFAELAKKNATPVEIVNLKIGEFNGNLWFACDDVRIVNNK